MTANSCRVACARIKRLMAIRDAGMIHAPGKWNGPAIGAHIAPHQLQRRAAAKKIEHEHGDIGEDGELLKGAS